MCVNDKEQKAYERYRRYKRVKNRSDSMDFGIGMIYVILFLIVMKFVIFGW